MALAPGAMMPGLPIPGAALNANAAVNDPYMSSVIAGGFDNGGGYSPYVEQQSQFARDVMNPDSQVGQQYGALKAARDTATQQKAMAIQNAMANLQAIQSGQTTNLPMLAAGAAMLAPTRTGSFSESLGAGLGAAAPVVAAQRAHDFQIGQEQNKLDIAGAEVPQQAAAQDVSDFMERLKLAEQAGQGAAISGGRVAGQQISADARRDVAGQQADARERVAQIAAGAKISVADLNADRSQWSYLGTDPDDPSTGIYFNRRTNSTNQGPAVDVKVGGAGADPARVREAKELIKQGVAPDFGTAYGMVRSGTNDANNFQRLVQAEKAILQKSMGGMNMTNEQLENQARENVVARYGAQPGKGGAATTTAPAGGGSAGGTGASATPGAPAPAAQRSIGAAAGTAAMPAPGGAQAGVATPEQIDSARRAMQRGVDRATIIETARQRGITLPPDF